MVTIHLLPLDLSPAAWALVMSLARCKFHSFQQWSSPLERRTKYRIAYVRGVFLLRTDLSPSLESWGET